MINIILYTECTQCFLKIHNRCKLCSKELHHVYVSLCKYNNYSSLEWLYVLTPPQFNVLARSLPVPRGRMATAGWGVMPRLSIWDRIHPTVPSPPQASIRKFGTFLYNSSLQSMTKQKIRKHFSTFQQNATMYDNITDDRQIAAPCSRGK